MLQVLEFIWQFLQWCYYVIEACVRFLVDTIVDLAYTLSLCAKVISILPTFFYWLPSYILEILLVIFGIVVVYKFIGREG